MPPRAREAVLSARDRTLALAWGALASATAYPLLRIAQALRGPEPDPADVLWSEHAPFYWRAATALFIGGIAVVFVSIMAQPTRRFAARWLGPAVVVVALLALAQAAFVP